MTITTERWIRGGAGRIETRSGLEDSELVRRLESEGRVRYLSAAADALDNPESALCRALAKGPLGRISPIEHLLLEWIIANLLLPGIDHFDQAAMLLRVT
ncbi:MAG: hypothetical protein ACRDTH_23240 [Pseudonocardiaceae bacterium]